LAGAYGNLGSEEKFIVGFGRGNLKIKDKGKGKFHLQSPRRPTGEVKL
jgi:hypothetical protein